MKNSSEQRRSVVVKTLLYLLPVLLFSLSWGSLFYILAIILIVLIIEIISSKTRLKNQALWLEFAAILIVLSFLFNTGGYLQFNLWITSVFKWIGANSILINSVEAIDWSKILIVLFGFIIIQNEINVPIRNALSILNVLPESNNEKELKAGRVIGMLERSIVYVMVLSNNYTAIGFIVAAKAFTRFKDLEKREFAEYVLIGTLISVFSAIVVAELIKILLK